MPTPTTRTTVQVGEGSRTVGLSESGGCVLPGGTVASASAFPFKAVRFGGAFHAVVSTTCTQSDIGTGLYAVLAPKFSEPNPIAIIIEDWVDAPFSCGRVIPRPVSSIKIDINTNGDVTIALGFENQ